MLTKIRFVSIRTKLMVIISALVLLSLFFLITTTLNLFQKDLRNMVTLNSGNNARMMSDKIDAEINHRLESLRLLDAGRGKNPALADRYFTDTGDFLAIAWFSEDNGQFEREKILYREPKLVHAKITADEIEKALYLPAMELAMASQGKTTIRALGRTKTGAWLLAGARYEGQKGRGVVAAVMRSDTLAALFSTFKSRGSTTSLYRAFLTDAQHRLVADSETEKSVVGTDLNKHPVVAYMAAQKVGKNGVRRYELDGVHELGAFQKLSTAEATILTTVNEDIALEGVRRARTRALLIALLIIAIAVLFIYFFSKTISEPIKRLATGTKKIREGNYDIKLDPSTHDEIGDLTTDFNAMAKGLEEREKLKGAFGKFVNEEIAERVLSGRLALGGESKEVTIFFSDIRSFTSISEKLTPLEVVGFLNEYLTLMVGIVRKKGGTVDKFIGDAIMALFGAPLSTPNDPVNAVETALMMREGLKKYNVGRGSRAKPIIKIGMGINTGPVLAGQIGSEDRLEYTVIGDAVNLASRLEGLNKVFGTDILISETTHALVKDKFHCVPMRKVKVKGKQSEQKVFAVLGFAGDPKAPKNLKELHKLVDMYPGKKIKY
ncbi:MAG: HAMP domain-containing protein [Spirochaetes bacterium]|nr:HAMP domain-containing protein [Spirochaetota bacterium]MBX3722865.1 HAMP domain-containing protein [Turneriella sp.]